MASGIFWTESDGDHVLVLTLPLQERRPGHAKTRLPDISLDRTVRQVYVISPTGQPAPRVLMASIRHDQAPDTIDAMIEAGLDGIDLILIPDLTDQSESYTVQLMQATSAQLESEGRQNLFNARNLVFQRMDGGPLS